MPTVWPARTALWPRMGDPMLAAVQGGVVILHPGSGSIMGGIGVSGLAAQEDEDLAKIGLKALGL